MYKTRTDFYQKPEPITTEEVVAATVSWRGLKPQGPPNCRVWTHWDCNKCKNRTNCCVLDRMKLRLDEQRETLAQEQAQSRLNRYLDDQEDNEDEDEDEDEEE